VRFCTYDAKSATSALHADRDIVLSGTFCTAWRSTKVAEPSIRFAWGLTAHPANLERWH